MGKRKIFLLKTGKTHGKKTKLLLNIAIKKFGLKSLKQ